LIKPTSRNEPLLAIVAPIVRAGKMDTIKKLSRPPEIETPFRQGLIALCWIKRDQHNIYCSYI
jgi:hypothetical protein